MAKVSRELGEELSTGVFQKEKIMEDDTVPNLDLRSFVPPVFSSNLSDRSSSLSCLSLLVYLSPMWRERLYVPLCSWILASVYVRCDSDTLSEDTIHQWHNTVMLPGDCALSGLMNLNLWLTFVVVVEAVCITISNVSSLTVKTGGRKVHRIWTGSYITVFAIRRLVVPVQEVPAVCSYNYVTTVHILLEVKLFTTHTV